jgi:SAM-dependent methyltransferase
MLTVTGEQITQNADAFYEQNCRQEPRNAIEKFELFIAEKRFLDKAAFNQFLQELKSEIESQQLVSSREEIVEMLTKIRSVFRESPFAERVQKWPRGYQGDFETIDYIMKAKNKAKEGTFGYVLEDFFLNSDICKQHKNKVERQAQLIKQTISAKKDARIISIGCGTSEDIKCCIAEIQKSKAEITLVDVDQNAIDFSLHQLSGIKDRVSSLTGNIYKLMRTLTEKYDLMLIGGVFDYLNDKTIVSVLSSLRANLADGGKLFFTNIDKNNPYRAFMEYTSDWILIERSKSDLAKLITDAGWPEASCQTGKDNTGLTHLVELNDCKLMA